MEPTLSQLLGEYTSQSTLEDAALEPIAKQLGWSWEGVKKAIELGAYRAKS